MKRLALVLLLSVLAGAQAPTLSYTYTIPYDVTNVSIAVKDSTGALIRTILGGQNRNAGTYSGIWDGLTDAGIAASNGPFTVVALYGNPVYTYWGSIGDTASRWNGFDRWDLIWNYPPLDRVAFVGNTNWVTEAGSEGLYALASFSDADPNTPHITSPGYVFQNIMFNDIASDGRYLYLSSPGGWTNPGSHAFVTKFDGLNGYPAFFSDPSVAICSVASYPAAGCNGVLSAGPPLGGNPTTAQTNAVNWYYGVTMTQIDFIKNTSVPIKNTVLLPPTSIAVQQTGVGTLLAVGHGNQATNNTWNSVVIAPNNDIKFFNKDTGLAVGSDATVPNPISMAFSSAGLWAIGDGNLYLVSNPSGTNTVSQPISGLSYPMAVDTGHGTTNLDHIYVLDGGTSQQLKEYDASYNLVRTYGVPGGYTDCDPTIAHNRLMVDMRAIYGTNGANPTFGNISITTLAELNFGLPSVRAEPNGDVWIQDSLDGGRNHTGRLQHLTPSGGTYNYVNQIFKVGMNYTLAVNRTNPSRVFVGFIEYKVNWSATNVPGDPEQTGTGAWQPYKDWYVGSSGACGTNNAWHMDVDHPPNFFVVETLSNGRTYAYVGQTYPPSPTGYIVELPASGPLRIAEPIPTTVRGYYLESDFGTHYWTTAGTAMTMNYVPPPTFDANANPQWGTAQQLFTFNVVTGQAGATNVTWGGPYSHWPSTGGVYASVVYPPFYASNPNSYAWPHIWGAIAGRSTTLWSANIEACYTYAGMDAKYPCGVVGNAGTGIVAEGRYFLNHYCGNSIVAAPQYWLYYEDGMFIGQFGGWSTNSWTPVGPNTARNQVNSLTTSWKGQQPLLTGLVNNCTRFRMITFNGNLYVITATESQSRPINAWVVSNLSSIQEVQGTGTLGQRNPITLDQKVDMLKVLTLFKGQEKREERREDRRKERRRN